MTSPSRTALLLVVNARVFTGDPRRPWMDAVIFELGAPPRAGSSAEFRKLATPATPVMDAAGAELRLEAGAVFLPSGQRLSPPG